MSISYEVKIKRGSTVLVLPDSVNIGTVQDRIHALLTSVAVPGDEIVIKLWAGEDRL